MSGSIIKSWKFWLGITISAVFLYIAFRGIDFSRLGRDIRHVRLLWIAAGIGAYFFNLGWRAFRWGYIFRHVKKVSFWKMLGATIVGYFANNVLPMRLGELGRALYIGEKEGAEKSAALGTIAVERIFDGLSALVILAFTFWMYPFPKQAVGEFSGYFKKAGEGLLGVSIFGLGLMIFMVVKRDLTMRGVDFFLRPFPERSRQSIGKVALSFINGLTILSSPVEVLVLIVLSGCVWLTNLLPVFCSGMAFKEAGLHFGLLDTFVVLVAGMVAAAIPASPGFVGTFHYITKKVVIMVLTVKFASGGIAATGVAPENFRQLALSYAVIVHALYILTTTITGAIILSASGVSFAKLRNASPAEAQATPPQPQQDEEKVERPQEE